MRFISLNLDLDDAAVLRRALEVATAGCGCLLGPAAARCRDCDAIGAVLGDLDRLLISPGRAADRSFGSVVERNQMVGGMARSSDDGPSHPTPTLRNGPRLRVVRGGLVDANR